MRSNNLKTSKKFPLSSSWSAVLFILLFPSAVSPSFHLFDLWSRLVFSAYFKMIKMINYKCQSVSQLSLYLLFHPPFISSAPPCDACTVADLSSLFSKILPHETAHTCSKTPPPLPRRRRAGRQLGSALAFRACTPFDAGTEAACDWH